MGTTLHHDDDSSRGRTANGKRAHKARSGLSGSAGSVLDLGITAGSWKSHGKQGWQRDPEWAADLEYIWRTRVRPDVDRLELRARRLRLLSRDPGLTPWGRVCLLRSSEWHANRARSAAMSRADIVSVCRKRWRKVGCGCGVIDILVGCDQTMLCEWCREKHWRRWRRRITRAMGPHLRAAIDLWSRRGRRGPRPGIYLLTLTAPHTGDLGADRRIMGDAWRELSKRASYGGYALGGRYSMRKWWGHHALVWEATKGTKGDGHLHAHVAVISQWVPYVELRQSWGESIPGARVVDVVSPADARERADKLGRKHDAVGGAAKYLAKYVTKGVEPKEMSGRKAGELLIAFRGRRKVTTSRGFWIPITGRRGCKTCGREHRLVSAPEGLQVVAPAAVLKSLCERVGRWVCRGAPQVGLRFDVGG